VTTISEYLSTPGEPGKVLGFGTAREVYLEEVLHLA
jgi:hypothetical protein